jgi:hypothetical protein
MRTAGRRIGTWDRIVENDHNTVALKMLERAIEAIDRFAERVIVVLQDGNDVFGLGLFGKRGKAAEVAEYYHDVAAVSFQKLLIGNHDFGDLRRKKILELVHAIKLGNLLVYPLFERLVPTGKIPRQDLDLVVELLDAQHRAHAGDQRRLIDRLGEIFVGAGVEPSNDVL